MQIPNNKNIYFTLVSIKTNSYSKFIKLIIYRNKCFLVNLSIIQLDSFDNTLQAVKNLTVNAVYTEYYVH